MRTRGIEGDRLKTTSIERLVTQSKGLVSANGAVPVSLRAHFLEEKEKRRKLEIAKKGAGNLSLAYSLWNQ